MSIKLPQKFNNILKEEYRAFVDTAITRFKDIYTNNKLDFFQDFTDHGIRHIEEVLEAASNIIDDDSYKYLNERDISVLVISVLLHDLGMHISNEGVKKILSDEYSSFRVKEFDSKTWKEEWTSFFQEAKRFNDEQLKNIFGTSDQNISEPNIDHLDDYSRKIYGEYLRRYHHRLAHEIALGGFPTKLGEENIKIHSDDIDPDIIDLAGLVARSHGMPIRKSTDYLEAKFQEAWRAPYNVKVIFLMVILRIADYLQIHSERASKVILKSKNLDSPISKREWEKHNSIKDINIKTADPERIFVIAKPDNSVIYLELEKLFEDIQSEFDISWAILGEAYGRDEELSNLKIKFRRIRSVLDDKEEFQKHASYIPERVFFNADPALLKLLIGPLYGEDPKYGVRELLQNSVDAVKEREYLNKKIIGNVSISLQPIKKDKPRYEIIITDSGIGMTKDTIINYFFKAGASFRKSMAWKKDFVDDGETKIQKTGRFGVGVLAAFLLGDEFELWTKFDAQDSQGYYCKATLGMTQVELIKDNCNVGTTIKIPLRESVNTLINLKLKELEAFGKGNNTHSYYYNNKPILLEWFTWYLMDKPKIEFIIDESINKAFRFVKPKLLLSCSHETPSSNWRSFSTNDYKSIHWVLDLTESIVEFEQELKKFDHHDQLACNGFKISRGYTIKDQSYRWVHPKVSIFDNNASFPLSLSRDYIQGDNLPFEEDLFESIAFEIIQSLLRTEFRQVGPYFIPKSNPLKFIGQVDLSEFILVLGDEFTLLNPSILSYLKKTAFVQFWFKHSAKQVDLNFIPNSPYQASIISSDPINFYKPILEGPGYYGGRYNHWFNLSPEHSHRRGEFSRKFISTDKLKYLLEGKRLGKYFKETLSNRVINKGWSEITEQKTSGQRIIESIKNLKNEVYPLIIERHPVFEIGVDDFFAKAWKKFLGAEWSFPIEANKRPELIKKKN